MRTQYCLALAAILLVAGCKTANDRVPAGPVDYACDCGKKARGDAGAQMPICCGKTMKVTSTIKDRTEWQCANINCGQKQWTDPDVPAPTCCDGKAMIRQ